MREERLWDGCPIVIHSTADTTNGELTVVEVHEPPNAEAPLHVHDREDEGFFVLEGNVTLEVGGETIEAGPGEFAWGPRKVPHRYTAGPEGCRMLFICTPGGFEAAVRERSVPV